MNPSPKEEVARPHGLTADYLKELTET